jgi:hypothetical protein
MKCVKAIEDLEFESLLILGIAKLYQLNVLLLGWSIDERAVAQLNCLFDDNFSTIDSVCYVSSLF